MSTKIKPVLKDVVTVLHEEKKKYITLFVFDESGQEIVLKLPDKEPEYLIYQGYLFSKTKGAITIDSTIASINIKAIEEKFVSHDGSQLLLLSGNNADGHTIFLLAKIIRDPSKPSPHNWKLLIEAQSFYGIDNYKNYPIAKKICEVANADNLYTFHSANTKYDGYNRSKDYYNYFYLHKKKNNTLHPIVPEFLKMDYFDFVANKKEAAIDIVDSNATLIKLMVKENVMSIKRRADYSSERTRTGYTVVDHEILNHEGALEERDGVFYLKFAPLSLWDYYVSNLEPK